MAFCEDVFKSPRKLSDPPASYPGQEIAPQAQRGPLGSLDWVKALTVTQTHRGVSRWRGDLASLGSQESQRGRFCLPGHFPGSSLLLPTPGSPSLCGLFPRFYISS